MALFIVRILFMGMLPISHTPADSYWSRPMLGCLPTGNLGNETPAKDRVP